MEIRDGFLNTSSPEQLKREYIADRNKLLSVEAIESYGMDAEKVQAAAGSKALQVYQPPVFTSPLYGYIQGQFQINKELKRTSGIEQELVECLQAYNGEYSNQEIQKIKQTGGTTIFMNLTALKSRAAASWIRDIQLPAKEKSWLLEPTPVPELPQGIRGKIEKAVEVEFGDYVKGFSPQPRLNPPQAEGQPQQAPESQAALSPQQSFQPAQGNTSSRSPASKAANHAKTMKEYNQAKRDIEEMVLDEINKMARHEMKKMERKIEDQLAEGKWADALSDFIDDFVVYPSAIIKGPIISKDNTLTYKNGKAVPSEKFIYLNRRVSPFDAYPSGNSSDPNNGSNFIEHLRMTRRDLAGLRGLPGYKIEAIDDVLKNSSHGSSSFFDSGIENEKAVGEKRGTESSANYDVIHGLHFFGSIPVNILKTWGMTYNELGPCSDTDEKEIEAIVAGNHVIKCVINKDPLRRRPYYKASYQNRPGAFWGRALPILMRDIQRICNATARALVNNMGLASGPQIELYVDRLADNSDISNIYPFKIWQLTSDPTGGGGRAINFHQPSSNAAELLAVYKEFEIRADDVTGIPRYSYGNERVGGAAMTASGLSMLLESASKAVKDCVRNIDKGVIVPRIEYQFYWNIVTDPHNFYSGDPKVVARGSSALTMKGAEQMRRNEFLQITSNPMDQQIMGLNGRAEILRRVADDLNMGENLIPSRLELRAQQEEAAAAASSQREQELKLRLREIEAGIEATQLQIEGQKSMHVNTQDFKRAELEYKQLKEELTAEIALAKLEASREGKVVSESTKLRQAQFLEQGKDRRFDTEVALKLKRGEGI